MQLNQPDLLNTYNQVFHVSEEPGIKLFIPRPSPSFFKTISGDVVFGISGHLLHNYLLPRDCPRVTFYAGPDTTPADEIKFMSHTKAKHIVAVETAWLKKIRNTQLHVYAFNAANFSLIDECAGYYVSYNEVVPVANWVISDILSALVSCDIELRIMPDLSLLADSIKASSMRFSLIRMRNAQKGPF